MLSIRGAAGAMAILTGVHGATVTSVAGAAWRARQATPVASNAERLRAEAECPSMALPAYAHNDYANLTPLMQALRLGYRGVEVDVFLIGGVLRVGHDREAARHGGTLDSIYLRPLQALLTRCGEQLRARPLFLNIEVKEKSAATTFAVGEALMSYRELLIRSGTTGAGGAPLTVTLVGWTGSGTGHSVIDSLTGMQCHLQHLESAKKCAADSRVRLISLDYGKTMGRWWMTDGRRSRWLAMLQQLRQSAPGAMLRAHNVPANARVYKQLLDAGIDLIGTKTLQQSSQILISLRNNSSTTDG